MWDKYTRDVVVRLKSEPPKYELDWNWEPDPWEEEEEAAKVKTTAAFEKKLRGIMASKSANDLGLTEGNLASLARKLRN